VIGGWKLYELEGKRTLAFYSVYSDIRLLMRKTALRVFSFIINSLLDKQPELEELVNSSTAALVARGVKARAEGKIMKLGDWESKLPNQVLP